MDFRKPRSLPNCFAAVRVDVSRARTTLIFKTLPTAHVPTSEQHEPVLTNDLTLKLEPRFTKFNTDIALPHLALPLNEIEEPICTNDNTEQVEPIFVADLNDKPEPQIA